MSENIFSEHPKIRMDFLTFGKFFNVLSLCFIMKSYIFVGILILAIVSVIIFIQNTGSQCYSDSDCVPKDCCHATQCIPKSDAPNCSEIMCTAECVENTLDCGQGFCACEKGICKAKLK